MTTEGHCKSCGARITWARLNGRWHPCDPEKISIIVVGASPAAGTLVSGHESHFATCPNAAEHRKGSDGGKSKTQG